MPIYEYQCLDCGAPFEELVLSCDEKPDCPVCKSKEVVKKVSAFASGGFSGSGVSAASSCGHSHGGFS